jgi:hypothetical protein
MVIFAAIGRGSGANAARVALGHSKDPMKKLMGRIVPHLSPAHCNQISKQRVRRVCGRLNKMLAQRGLA